MILELEIDFIKKLNISLNQLILLSLINSGSKSNVKNASDVLNLIPGKEIEDLVNRNIVIINKDNDNVIYKISKEVEEMLEKQQASYFDEFYNTFPVYVLRPDGTKGFLRGNINKCRSQYNSIVGNSEDTANRIYDALKFQIEHYTNTGKLSYFKTMWNWITKHEWEAIEDEMNYESTPTNTYGTELV